MHVGAFSLSTFQTIHYVYGYAHHLSPTFIAPLRLFRFFLYTVDLRREVKTQLFFRAVLSIRYCFLRSIIINDRLKKIFYHAVTRRGIYFPKKKNLPLGSNGTPSSNSIPHSSASSQILLQRIFPLIFTSSLHNTALSLSLPFSRANFLLLFRLGFYFISNKRNARSSRRQVSRKVEKMQINVVVRRCHQLRNCYKQSFSLAPSSISRGVLADSLG